MDENEANRIREIKPQSPTSPERGGEGNPTISNRVMWVGATSEPPTVGSASGFVRYAGTLW